MWWDCLRSLTGELHTVKTPELLPTMRQAMLAMLHSENAPVVSSAVHGLGHLVGGLGDDTARNALVALLESRQETIAPKLRKDLEDAIAGRTW